MSQRLDRLAPSTMRSILLAAPGGAFEDRTRLQTGIWLLGRLGLEHGIRHWTCEGSPSADAIQNELAAGIAQARIARELQRLPGRPMVEVFRALRIPVLASASVPGLSVLQLLRAVHLLHVAPVRDVTMAAVVDWLRTQGRCRDWRSHTLSRVLHSRQNCLERAAGLLRTLGIDPDLAEIAGASPETI